MIMHERNDSVAKDMKSYLKRKKQQLNSKVVHRRW